MDGCGEAWERRKKWVMIPIADLSSVSDACEQRLQNDDGWRAVVEGCPRVPNAKEFEA
jgi:hypothetical protein